jgi:protein phosphatase
MAQAHPVAAVDPALLVATSYRQVSLGDEQQIADAVSW